MKLTKSKKCCADDNLYSRFAMNNKKILIY